MAENSPGREPIDFGKAIEAALLGAFVLIGKYFLTVYTFFVFPRMVAGHLDGTTSQEGKFNRIARPLTFLALSLAASLYTFIGIIKALGVPEMSKADLEEFLDQNPFVVLAIEGLLEVSIPKLLLAIAPILLAISLYAYTTTIAAAKSNIQFGFKKSIGLCSYFCGTIANVYILAFLFLPLFWPSYSIVDLESAPTNWPWWRVIITAILYGFILRCIFCYFCIFVSENGCGWKAAFIAWWGGTWRFLVAYLLILTAVLPLAFAYLLDNLNVPV